MQKKRLEDALEAGKLMKLGKGHNNCMFYKIKLLFPTGLPAICI